MSHIKCADLRERLLRVTACPQKYCDTNGKVFSIQKNKKLGPICREQLIYDCVIELYHSFFDLPCGMAVGQSRKQDC